MLSLKMRFSERIGKRPVRTVLQVDEIDSELLNRLWNVFVEELEMVNYYGHIDNNRSRICKAIWIGFLNYPLTSIPKTLYNVVNALLVLDEIRKWFVKAQWYDVYDFVEYVCSEIEYVSFTLISKKFNNALTKSGAGYRIIENKVVQITSEDEIQSIEEALDTSQTSNSVHQHLDTALKFLADKQAPDYRNSIKESISAVEALCRIVAEDHNATLGKALAIIEKKHGLHPTLKEAYNKIYGYTSDADGIRHALLEDGLPIEFEDAKFMLVSCSAFINYLRSKLKL
jgi:hypothetical protein